MFIIFVSLSHGKKKNKNHVMAQLHHFLTGTKFLPQILLCNIKKKVVYREM